MSYLKIILFNVIIFISPFVLAADFSTETCSFEGVWTQLSSNTYSTEIEYTELLFSTASSVQRKPISLDKYTQTFRNFKIEDPYIRLNTAKDLWIRHSNSNQNDAGVVLTIDTILNRKAGKIREVSCLESGLFEIGAKYQGFDLSIPIYLEVSWSLWQKEKQIKIVMELGQLNSVTSNIKYFNQLFLEGWIQIFDIHSHPALHMYPGYKGEDFGPNLFPSIDDTQYWDGTLKWGNRRAIMIDGIYALEVTSEDINYLGHQYYCSKFKDSYLCK